MSAPNPTANFAAPWEAQVFAMVVTLQERGLFTWAEWSDRLGREIRPADGPEAAADYGHWLATLETILGERAVAAPESIARRAAAFLRAAEATPHGQPIRIENDPLHRA